jgi:hypothetical protein
MTKHSFDTLCITKGVSQSRPTERHSRMSICQVQLSPVRQHHCHTHHQAWNPLLEWINNRGPLLHSCVMIRAGKSYKIVYGSIRDSMSKMARTGVWGLWITGSRVDLELG